MEVDYISFSFNLLKKLQQYFITMLQGFFLRGGSKTLIFQVFRGSQKIFYPYFLGFYSGLHKNLPYLFRFLEGAPKKNFTSIFGFQREAPKLPIFGFIFGGSKNCTPYFFRILGGAPKYFTPILEWTPPIIDLDYIYAD